MKRVVLIFLIGVYSLSALGIGLSGFYCCGKLKSITLAFTTNGKDKSTKGVNNEGCCKTKYQYYKVEDKHLATVEQATLNKYYTNPVSFITPYKNTCFVPQQVNILNGCNAPPLHTGVPIYISNRVFRV